MQIQIQKDMTKVKCQAQSNRPGDGCEYRRQRRAASGIEPGQMIACGLHLREDVTREPARNGSVRRCRKLPHPPYHDATVNYSFGNRRCNVRAIKNSGKWVCSGTLMDNWLSRALSEGRSSHQADLPCLELSGTIYQCQGDVFSWRGERLEIPPD
ncbi:hypothetical protein Bbelb_324160 [Branchiostoma belcheri]|nr:hypothetical protein Bbelb_324160 [Branchiostoma belcheri]